MSVEGEGHIGGHEDCRPVGIAANSSDSSPTEVCTGVRDQKECGEESFSWDELFVKTEVVSRAVVENDECLSRRCVTSDFRKGCAMLLGWASSRSTSVPTTISVAASGRPTMDCGSVCVICRSCERLPDVAGDNTGHVHEVSLCTTLESERGHDNDDGSVDAKFSGPNGTHKKGRRSTPKPQERLKELCESKAALEKELKKVNESKLSLERELHRSINTSETYNKEIEKISRERAGLKLQIVEMTESKVTLERELQKHISDKNTHDAEVRKLTSDTAALRKQLADVSESKAALEKELRELRASADAKSSRDAEVRKLTSDTAALRKQLADVSESKAALEKELRELRASADAKSSRDAEVRKLTSDTAALRKQLADVSESKAALEKELRELRASADAKSSRDAEVRKLTSDTAALRKQLADVSESKAALEEELRASADAKSSHEAEVRKLTSDTAALRKQLADVSESKAALEKELRELRASADAKSSRDAEVRKLTSDTAALRKQLADVSESKAALEKELRELRASADAKSSHEAEVRKLTSDTAALRKQLADVSESKAALEKELRELRASADAKSSHDAEVRKLTSDTAVRRKQLRDVVNGNVAVGDMLRRNSSMTEVVRVCDGGSTVACVHAEFDDISEDEGLCAVDERLYNSYDVSVGGDEGGLLEEKCEISSAGVDHSVLRAVRVVDPVFQRGRTKGTPDGETCHLMGAGESFGTSDEVYESAALQSFGAPVVQQLRGLKLAEREVRRCGKIVSQIAPCIKECRHFKRVMQLAERCEECGEDYAARTELQKAADEYRRRVLKAEGTWKRQDESLRLLEARVNAVGEELSRLLPAYHEHREGPGESQATSGEGAMLKLVPHRVHNRVCLMLRNVRRLLDDTQRHRQDRHEALLATLQRCCPTVAAAYVQQGGTTEWREAVAFSASAVGMLVLAVGSVLYGRYEFY